MKNLSCFKLNKRWYSGLVTFLLVLELRLRKDPLMLLNRLGPTRIY